MSEPLLNVMKIMLLCGLYLFFLRVLWSVFSELRDPRTVARKRDKRNRDKHARSQRPEAGGQARPAGASRPAAALAAATPSRAYATAGAPPPAQAPAATAESAAAGQLMIVEPPELAGHRIALGNGLTVGRAHTNGVVLDDTYVSTVHARIFLRSGTYFIEDLASRNGSMINDQQIVATTALSPGDRLQLGATAMEFS